ncbi:PWWP domain-containing protein [Mycena sanguinolenta]|uniref:PWWP domain-containing protein n=1 Tax=Mycena sanguinolenta TaxID=230812 RepID=A0A8H6XNX1_9AGAR|nr:PWWP domain-containing protein [Mycena sanguinolenta]
MSAKKSGSSAKKTDPEVFDIREVVLAKIRGFPPWPGMVVDPETVPSAVSKERPAGKKSVAYAIRFFPAGDYAWLGSKELSRLTTSQINAFVNDDSKKEGDLKQGYRKALDPAAWEAEHEANPPATKKRKNKSKKRDDEEEDDELGDEEEDAEAEDGEEDDKKSKKRKRASSPAPKSKAKPKAASGKAKKGGKTKKSKAAVESEDDAAADEGEGEDEEAERKEERPSKKSKSSANAEDVNTKLESDPEALKVREWRHKLQKTFLSSNKALPKEDEMPTVDALFTTVEGYQNMNIGYLTFSKIGKVMRHIHLLDAAKVPRDDEFHFRDRAKALVDKWHEILNSNSTTKAAEAEGAEGGDASTANANGIARMDLNGTAEGEGDLTVMDVTMDES